MESRKANSILSNYMNCDTELNYDIFVKYNETYDTNMNMVVDVWNKLGVVNAEICSGIGESVGKWFCSIRINNHIFDGGEESKVSSVCCIATAKLIQKLGLK